MAYCSKDELVATGAAWLDERGVTSGEVKVWSATEGKDLATIRDRQQVGSVAFTPDGTRLAYQHEWAKVNLCNPRTGEILSKFPVGHSRGIARLAFSRDGALLASAGQDKDVAIWDVATSRLLRSLRGHTEAVTDVAFSGDGRVVASTAADNAVKTWEARTGRELFTLHGAGGDALAFARENQQLFTSSRSWAEPGLIKTWDATSGPEARALKGHTAGVTGVAFSPDSARLASTGFDRTIRVWDVGAGRELRLISARTSSVRCPIVFSPDGRSLVSPGDENVINVWDSQTAEIIRELKGHTTQVSLLAFSPDGRRLASFSGNQAYSRDGKRKEVEDGQSIRIWDMQTGKDVLTIPHRYYPAGLAFSADGNRIAANADGCIKIWDAKTGNELSVLPRGQGMIAFSSDRKHLASSAYTGNRQIGEAMLWDSATDQPLFALHGHKYTISGLAFSPDGKRLVTGSLDRTLKLWDVATGQEVLTLTGHSDSVYDVAFSPDGRRIASAGYDNTVRLWDATPHAEAAARTDK